jgi:hypothetical protein
MRRCAVDPSDHTRLESPNALLDLLFPRERRHPENRKKIAMVDAAGQATLRGQTSFRTHWPMDQT